MNEKGMKRKKKTFLQKTMKYYKKGVKGRGTHIDEETYQYFLHVLKIMNQEFDSDEEKRAFVDNVFEQMAGNEVDYSCNQVVSRIADNLLPHASEDTLLSITRAFTEKIRLVCNDQFASFVMQKLLITVTKRTKTLHESDDKREALKEWLTSTFKYILNNAEEFVWNEHANHIVRTVVCCMTDKPDLCEKNYKANAVVESTSVEPEYVQLLREFTDRLMTWTEFGEMAYNKLSSGFLQVLVQCLPSVGPKRLKAICKKLTDECFAVEDENGVDEGTSRQANETSIGQNGQYLPSSFTNEPCMRLLEAIICVAPPKQYTKIYSKCFENRLSTISKHREANYALQKLISNCSERVQFDAIFDELRNDFEDIMESGNTGVILNLCEGCVRHKTKQPAFMQNWMKYIGCGGSNEAQTLIAPLTIYLKKMQDYSNSEDYTVQLHGSLLLQNLLKFSKPIKVVSSLLEIKSDQLIKILSDPKGSHIADAFFESSHVGEKSRDKFIRIMLGSYTSLAVSKHGSRVFDVVWKSANLKNRIAIADELVQNECRLSPSSFGRPIVYNISLGGFRHSRDAWIKAQSTGDKVQKLFSHIV